MKRIILALIILIFISCKNEPSKEKYFKESTAFILKESSVYKLSYPNTWVLKNARYANSAEIFKITANALADIDYSFMIVPDSLGGDRYIENMKNAISDRKQLIDFKKIMQCGKEFESFKYSLNDAYDTHIEQLIHVKNDSIYSLTFAYSHNTDTRLLNQGREILKSFCLK